MVTGMCVVSFCFVIGIGACDLCFGEELSELERGDRYFEECDYDQAETTYRGIIASDVNSDAAMSAQERLCVLYVTVKRQADANTAYNDLLARYSDRTGVAKAVDHVADVYRERHDYEQARRCYQYVANQWPEADHAAEAQASVARSYILMGDNTSAQRATDALLQAFGTHPRIAEAVDLIADEYRKSGQYSKARPLHQYVVEHWPEAPHAMEAQKGVAVSSVKLGDDTGARSAVDKLVADYSGREKFSKALCEVAQRCEEAESFDLAKDIYRRVERVCPNTVEATASPVNIRKADIMSLIESGRDGEVVAAVDSMIADFNDHPHLAYAVYKVAVYYHVGAYALDRRDLTDQAQSYFRRAAVLFEKVARTFPEYDNMAKVCASIGDCYEKVGEYEKSITWYQRVVDDYPSYRLAWRALYYVGHNHLRLANSGRMSKADADAGAQAAYELLVEKYPGSEGAKHAEYWLNREIAE